MRALTDSRATPAAVIAAVAAVAAMTVVVASLAGCSAVSGSGSATASPVTLPADASPTVPASGPASAGASATGAASGAPTGTASAGTAPSASVSGSAAAVSGEALLASARKAFLAAKGVRLVGKIQINGALEPLDVRIVGDTGAIGKITFPTGTFALLLSQDVVYVKGDRATWARTAKGVTLTAEDVTKWVRVLNVANYTSLLALTKPAKFAEKSLTLKGTAVIGPAASVRGTAATTILDTEGNALYVEAATPHRPLAIVFKDPGRGRLDFLEYGKTTAVPDPGTFGFTEIKGF